MNKNLAERGEPYTQKNWEIIRFQFYVISILNKFPRLKKVAIFLWEYIRISRYQRLSKKLLINKDNGLDVDKIYWVDPKKIRYTSLKEFVVSKDKGKIIGGNWDLLERPFKELDVYVAFRERFIEGKKWHTTVFYNRILNEIKQGKFLWGCQNQSDFAARLKNLENLFESIKKNGYKSQGELLSGTDTANPTKLEDEVAVNIGRNGDLLFNNGAHRLSIALLLNLLKIPIKITIRHPQWVDFRKQILLYAKDQKTRKIYQPITHIDLQDIPSFHETEIDRFELIRKNLSIKKGRLLDIGSNWGYFCHRFEEIGFECYAVEMDHINVYFLEKLKRAENRHFTIIPKSIFDIEKIKTTNFDIVLALNIFHHFLKNEDYYQQLVQFLNNLQVKEMYFQPHCPSELQMENAYKNYLEEEFVDFILKNSHFRTAKHIGTAQDGRTIYKLS